jgi:hypothetical protein
MHEETSPENICKPDDSPYMRRTRSLFRKLSTHSGISRDCKLISVEDNIFVVTD